MEFFESDLSPQKVIGISVKADNSPAGLAKITALWQKFNQEKVLQKIPNKVSDEVFAIYTDYEGDQNKPYTFILGAKVFDFEEVPSGMITHEIPEQKYAIFTASGVMPQALTKTWQKIWAMKLERKFSSDFEIHNEDSNQGADSETEIYIAIK